MAEDWLADVRKYVADADEAVVSKIVKYLGIALRNRDSSLVAFSDKKETDRVRENFLKKKLALTHDDATLDAAIAGVGEQMKGDRTKNRVTVYYLLARHFDLLTLFGGAATGAAGLAGAAAGLAAVGGTDGGTAGADGDAGKDDDGSSAAPLAAAGLTGTAAAAAPAPATAAPAAVAPAAAPPPASATPQTAYSGGDDENSGGGMGWLPWLLLALLLAALIFFGLRYCSKQEAAVAPAADETAISETVAPADGAAGAAGAATAAAIPEGAGVVAADREGKPMLTVYFDTGKSEVSNDLSTAASSVKAYLESNPAATLAVSGYNDPTGNAAANAELSKKRAQSVKAALEKLGFAADKVVLEKPAETTTTGADNSAARRVEVTVKG